MVDTESIKHSADLKEAYMTKTDVYLDNVNKQCW